MYVNYGGVANDTVMDRASLHVKSGGVANRTTVNSRFVAGTVAVVGLGVYSGGSANDTVINCGGSMYVSNDGMANDTVVNSGGSMSISSGGTHRGTLQLTNGAVVSAYAGATIDFTLNDRTTADDYLINNLSLITGTPAYTITVSANQSTGTYKLAQGAGSFNGTITIGDGNVNYGNLSVNGTHLVVGDTTYGLTQTSGNLSLVVGRVIPMDLVISGNPVAWTNQNVTLTASSENAEKIEYSFDGSRWYTGSVVTVDRNRTVWFRATDSTQITLGDSVTVSKIDKTAPTLSITGNAESVTQDEVTLTAVYSDGASGVAKVEYSFDGSKWNTGSTVTVYENKTVRFRVTDLAGNVTEKSVVVDKIDTSTLRAPRVSASTTEFTNQAVTLTANFWGAVKKEYSYNNRTWYTYNGSVVMNSNTTVYFRGSDSQGNVSDVTSYRVTNIDKLAPQIPTGLFISMDNGNIFFDWQDARDVGKAGIAGYYIRYGQGELTGEGTFVESSQFDVPDLSIGTWNYQVRSLDAAGNLSDWSEKFTLFIASPAPTGLTGSADGLKWDAVEDATLYVVEYSTDDFATAITIETTSCFVDSYALPEGPFKWRVRSDSGLEWAYGEEITAEVAESPEILTSDADGDMDLFFGNANGIWEKQYAAQHLGNDTWNGTREIVLLEGKNRIADIFAGSFDANVLVLTDDANGDALFVDDIYTALGDQARFAQINVIRAGAGDDIVDMTSQRYAYNGWIIKVCGGDGNDTIWGSAEQNLLFGDAGADRLVGASGNDILAGGSGNDRMHGGGGDDIFTFGGNWGHDTVEQLASGSVTLWFETGSESNWNAETSVYTDGTNSVSVSGSVNVTLRFGASADLPAGKTV